MGMMHHHAVVATTWNEARFAEAVAWIKEEPEHEQPFFVVGPKVMNDHQAVIVIPDGSKEGWDYSDQGNDRRQRFIAFLKLHDYDDGSSPWAWVEVSFGELGATVESTNCENKY